LGRTRLGSALSERPSSERKWGWGEQKKEQSRKGSQSETIYLGKGLPAPERHKNQKSRSLKGIGRWGASHGPLLVRGKFQGQEKERSRRVRKGGYDCAGKFLLLGGKRGYPHLGGENGEGVVVKGGIEGN